MTKICSKFETKKAVHICHIVSGHFSPKVRSWAMWCKSTKGKYKKQPCSLEAQLGSSLRRLLLQNVSHAAFVVVPSWPLGRERGRPLSEDGRQDGDNDGGVDYGNDVNQKQWSWLSPWWLSVMMMMTIDNAWNLCLRPEQRRDGRKDSGAGQLLRDSAAAATLCPTTSRDQQVCSRTHSALSTRTNKH